MCGNGEWRGCAGLLAMMVGLEAMEWSCVTEGKVGKGSAPEWWARHRAARAQGAFGQCFQHTVCIWGGAVQSQRLDLILASLFQCGILCDLMKMTYEIDSFFGRSCSPVVFVRLCPFRLN